MKGKQIALFFVLLTEITAGIWFYRQLSFEPLTLILGTLATGFSLVGTLQFSKLTGKLICVAGVILFAVTLVLALTSQPSEQSNAVEKVCVQKPILFSLSGTMLDNNFFAPFRNAGTGKISVNNASSVSIFAYPDSIIDPPRLVATMQGAFEVSIKLVSLKPSKNNAPIQAGIAIAQPGVHSPDHWIQLMQTASEQGSGVEFGMYHPNMPLPQNIPYAHNHIYLKLIVDDDIRGAFSIDGINWISFENAYPAGNISHTEIVLFGYATGNNTLEAEFADYHIDICREG